MEKYTEMIVLSTENTHGEMLLMFSTRQNLHPNIKFPMQQGFKKNSFFWISWIKIKMLKSLLIFIPNLLIFMNIFILIAIIPQNCMKITPYSKAHRICVINPNRKFRKIRLEELHQILSQTGYPIPLINKGDELAERNTNNGMKKLWSLTSRMSPLKRNATENYFKNTLKFKSSEKK